MNALTLEILQALKIRNMDRLSIDLDQPVGWAGFIKPDISINFASGNTGAQTLPVPWRGACELGGCCWRWLTLGLMRLSPTYGLAFELNS